MVCLRCHWNKNHNTLLCERKSPANQDVVICASYLKKIHATYNIIALTLPVKKSNTLTLLCTCV